MLQDRLAPLVANDHRSIRRRLRLLPVLATISLAPIGIAATAFVWQTYEGKPWTRDGTVRAYVVTLAPQVAGEVTRLAVYDNQFVHKGDLLMKIDPRDYQVAVDFGKAGRPDTGRLRQQEDRGRAPAEA
jgi:multidrug resistance efflux pump